MTLSESSTNEEILGFLKEQRDRLKKAEEERAEIKGQITQVKTSIDQDERNLKDQYGLDSTEAAEEEIKTLREQVITESNDLSGKLDKVESDISGSNDKL